MHTYLAALYCSNYYLLSQVARLVNLIYLFFDFVRPYSCKHP